MGQARKDSWRWKFDLTCSWGMVKWYHTWFWFMCSWFESILRRNPKLSTNGVQLWFSFLLVHFSCWASNLKVKYLAFNQENRGQYPGGLPSNSISSSVSGYTTWFGARISKVRVLQGRPKLIVRIGYQVRGTASSARLPTVRFGYWQPEHSNRM